MDETKKTITYVATALVLAIIAYLAAPSPVTPDAFLDQGEKFYPEFTDPNAATSLEVVSYDETTGSTRAFKVHFQDGRWTIPSHYDYPADASDHLAKTAAGVIDISKDDFRSDNVSDHEALGVIDPMDETNPSTTGRGTRITIRGNNDVVLADFIVGKTVPGRSGFRFVRVPDQKRVYASKVDVDLSTRFADWINTDVLEVGKNRLTRVSLNDYSIDERSGRVKEKDDIVLTKRDGTWRANKMSSGQKIDSTAMDELLTALDELSIIGVRPKPEGLSQSLTSESGESSISQADLLSLQSKGFFLSRDGRLLSNEGEIEVQADDGVVYKLRFGEVLYGEGLEMTAGIGGGEDEDKDPGETEARYMFVTTDFNSKYFPEPEKPTNEEFRGKADSLLSDADRANKQRAAKHDEWQRKMQEGRERSDELNRRFADWYYVISADSFEKLKLTRSDLLVTVKS
jgi:hypothetical protein